MALATLNDLFVDELKDLYSAENQLIKALPKMATAAESNELRSAFQLHLQQSEEHARRIEQIFQAGLDGSPRGKKCAAMEGLIKEESQVIAGEGAGDVIDAALIGAAQRVAHYEMAGYGTARAHALQLGYNNAVRLLAQSLEEEAAADQELTHIAENRINASAAQKHDAGLGVVER
jgi:ferritin-like metal-binding protein YciE